MLCVRRVSAVSVFGVCACCLSARVCALVHVLKGSAAQGDVLASEARMSVPSCVARAVQCCLHVALCISLCACHVRAACWRYICVCMYVRGARCAPNGLSVGAVLARLLVSVCRVHARVLPGSARIASPCACSPIITSGDL